MYRMSWYYLYYKMIKKYNILFCISIILLVLYVLTTIIFDLISPSPEYLKAQKERHAVYMLKLKNIVNQEIQLTMHPRAMHSGIQNTSCDADTKVAIDLFNVEDTVGGLTVNMSYANLNCSLWVFNKACNIVMKKNDVLHGYIYDIYSNFYWNTADADMRRSPASLEYFGTISKHHQVTTLALQLQPLFNNILPVKRYHVGAGLNELCTMQNLTQSCWRLLNKTGTFKPNIMFPGANIYPFMDTKGQQSNSANLLNVYLHMIMEGYISRDGIIATGPLNIYVRQCTFMTLKRYGVILHDVPMPPSGIYYDDVFVITQYYGNAYYHWSIENLPRLAPYVDFLKSNPHIKLHVHAHRSHPEEHLEILGFDRSRIVKGGIKAKRVYVPQGGSCGGANPIPVQLLATMYHEYIYKHFEPADLEHNTLLLVARTTGRHLIQKGVLVELLKVKAIQYNMTFEVFRDDPIPPLPEVMAMFHRAALIVAPHGAGLSNLMFSRAGTTVVEVLCNPQPNRCFQSLATVLGHVYVGLLSTVPHLPCKPLFVDLAYFSNLVDAILQHQ